ncbi:CocE/NonD hydrolase [Lojkania enalia]|uniref:CocE/NonD hydrolase n=1 Tax=Lojkania enalia TaxID=147567 RepID=A0A9P4JXT7_9PLEO|nr:CocE/NonD hydrolase [Didymosphaeria enalia]
MSAQPRGRLGSLIDRVVCWFLRFPTESCNFSIQSVRIPIGEGLSCIELAANLYRPILPGNVKPFGTVLIRTPYGLGLIGTIPTARAHASRGYVVLLVSCRGTFDSGGEFEPFRNEVQDGKAVVEWMREQDWYTGSFATIGGSYLGFVEWALLCDPPADMKCAFIAVAPHDMGRHYWGTGSLNLDVVAWANLVACQEEPGFWAFWRLVNSGRVVRPVQDMMPLAKSVKEFFQGKVKWINKIVGCDDLQDEWYTPMHLGRALERTNIPVLLTTGWFDLFLDQTIEQYEHLSKRGCTVALIIGPGDHTRVGLNPAMIQRGYGWIEQHLAGKPQEYQAPVQYYVTGANEWRKEQQWPPDTVQKILHLQSNYKLVSEAEGTESASSKFTFDPQNPTPTMGGNLLFYGGSVEDSVLAIRSDVLAFTTDPLPEDLEVCGNITVDLFHFTDIPYADIFVRISDVNARGRSHNVTETYKRLDPGQKHDIVHLELGPCAHRFSKRRKVRLLIAGGSHPHFSRNIGTENRDNAGSEMRKVTHIIYHESGKGSKITLPVMT